MCEIGIGIKHFVFWLGNVHSIFIYKLISVVTFVHFWTVIVHILHLFSLLILVKSHQRS